MIEKSSGCRPVPVAIGAVTLTLVTALASFLVASSLLPKPNCDMPKLTFPKDNPEWHEVDRMEVPDKNLIISRPLGANRCYVLPKRSPTEDDTPRPLIIINEPLSFQMLEHLAGSDAAAFCNGYDAFLARELKGDEAAATERNKRQVYGSNPAPAPAPQPSGGYSAPPAPPQPASQPSGGYSAPPAPQPAPQPSGGYSAPPAPQPSGGYSAAPAPEPASRPSGGYSAPPAPQPAPQPSGGYSAPPPAPQPSGGYSAPPPQPASQTGGSGGSGGYGGGAGGAAPNAASGAAANAGGVAVGAGQSAAAALSPLTGSAWTGEGIFGTAKDTGKSALQMGIDERTPRCTEVLLDCVDHVGQVQSCYTWVNGVLWMDRKCTDSKQFVIRMTKPPGRILKIAQQQWIECLKRRNEGKTC